MAIAIPNLTFTDLKIADVLSSTWPAQEAMIRGARTPAAVGPLTVQAVKAMHAAITKAMTTYEKEETVYLDTVQRLHGECKEHAQEAIRLLAACKDIQPTNPNRAKLFQGSIDRMQLMLTDVEAAQSAISRWRGALTAHQGVRGAMVPPDSMEELLEAKFLAVLDKQYKSIREPLITRMSKESDSITKITQFKERIADCLKAAKSMSKASGQDAGDLAESWKGVKDMADNWMNVIKFPSPSILQSNYEMLRKNQPKDKASIEMLAKKTEPTWVAQLKSTNSYIKTVKIKYDNFVSANKDIKTHPVIGKQLGEVTKQIAAMEKEVEVSSALVEKCQKQFKVLKL